MPAGRARGVVGLLSAVIISLAPVAGGAAGAVSDAAVAGAGPTRACPPTRAIGAIRPGMTGTGWTTVRGDRPEPFRVRVLGTLRDGIGPGRDLVIIKVRDLPGRRVVRVGGGIWSGMSGSPVYIRGRLAGAISYSLSDGPSAIGGMTPARYMERLFDVPRPGATGATRSAAAAPGDRIVVRVAGALGSAAAAEAGRSDREALVLRRLGIPVAVSGGVGTRRSFVARELRRQLGGVRMVTSGAASAAATGPASAPRAGQNLAGVISQGDVTVAAVGTVTAVCHGRVVGFGHPMTGEGAVAFGAARARTVTIVDGPDPYKLANIGRPFGTLDLDRLAGVRAYSRTMPRMLPITARVRSRTTGRVRSGRTRVAMAEWMPSVAADHLLYDIQAADERSGGGTAQLSWTIRGVRLDTGTRWTLRWADRVSDADDVAYASALRLYAQLDTLVSDPTTAAEIRSVSVEATVMRAATEDRVRRIEVSRNGGEWLRSGPVGVAEGDELEVRVSLRSRTGRTFARTVSLAVPTGVSGEGVIHVIGGATAPTNGCDPIDGSCPSSFGRLLDALRAAPRGDDLMVALEVPDGAGRSLRITRTIRLDHVVSGERQLAVVAGG